MSAYPTTDLLPEEIHYRHFYAIGENGVKIHYIREGEGPLSFCSMAGLDFGMIGDILLNLCQK